MTATIVLWWWWRKREELSSWGQGHSPENRNFKIVKVDRSVKKSGIEWYSMQWFILAGLWKIEELENIDINDELLYLFLSRRYSKANYFEMFCNLQLVVITLQFCSTIWVRDLFGMVRITMTKPADWNERYCATCIKRPASREWIVAAYWRLVNSRKIPIGTLITGRFKGGRLIGVPL